MIVSLTWPKHAIYQICAQRRTISCETIRSYAAYTWNQRYEIIKDHIIKSDISISTELNSHKDSIRFALALRADVMNLLSSHETSRADKQRIVDINKELKLWLGTVFTPDALTLQRITFDGSSGHLLEQVARGEAVHSVRSLSELKRRLGSGRRCFALFHHSLPNDPLTFIHIALTPDIAKSLK